MKAVIHRQIFSLLHPPLFAHANGGITLPPMIIEMRTYKSKPGLRAEFLKILKSKALPEHEKIGIKILGRFLSVEHDDTFFGCARFPISKAGRE